MKAGDPKGPVQLIAPGLLGFFQLKDQGNPSVISDELSGSIELRDWYLIGEAEGFQSARTVTLSPGVAGFVSFAVPGPIVVPANEFWFVQNFTVRAFTPLSTDSAIIRPAMQWPAGTTNVLTFAQQAARITGPGTAAVSVAENFWAPAGATLGIQQQEVLSATTLNAQGALLFTRLRR